MFLFAITESNNRTMSIVERDLVGLTALVVVHKPGMNPTPNPGNSDIRAWEDGEQDDPLQRQDIAAQFTFGDTGETAQFGKDDLWHTTDGIDLIETSTGQALMVVAGFVGEIRKVI